MQRNPCPVCEGSGLVGSERCTRDLCEEGASPTLSTNRVWVIFPPAGGIVLNVSMRTEDPPLLILHDLRRELAQMGQGDGPLYSPEDRYAQVSIRAQPGFLALLRLMRWDVVFDFQEVTGLPWPRQFQYHWHRNEPRKMSTFHAPPEESTWPVWNIAYEILCMQDPGGLPSEERVAELVPYIEKILGRK